ELENHSYQNIGNDTDENRSHQNIGNDSGGYYSCRGTGREEYRTYPRRRIEDKMVLEKDMLFATLDTTVRRISPGDNRDFLLSDTVGFIDQLPHTLIKAFRSTLAEACGADLLLQVVDYSDPHYREQMQVTEDTLRELGAEKIPCIYIMNKADRVMDEGEFPKVVGDKIFLSARKRIGMEQLLDLIRAKLFADYVDCEFLIPYTDGAAVAYLKEHAVVHSMDYQPEGVAVRANCKKSDAGRYRNYRRW
ncbi:MAG: 50S ribosome-binding GTPase, partial [Lachnospiraceae bacterium]|nr:50S ribosome-binding GTPase [Lachnospiraceae bacterium]